MCTIMVGYHQSLSTAQMSLRNKKAHSSLTLAVTRPCKVKALSSYSCMGAAPLPFWPLLFFFFFALGLLIFTSSCAAAASSASKALCRSSSSFSFMRALCSFLPAPVFMVMVHNTTNSQMWISKAHAVVVTTHMRRAFQRIHIRVAIPGSKNRRCEELFALFKYVAQTVICQMYLDPHNIRLV